MITMILLGAVFLAVVVPQAVAARTERKQAFVNSMQFHARPLAELHDIELEPTQAPRARSVVARRKSIFVFLLVSVAVTAVPAVVTPGKTTLAAQLATDNCLLAYVGLLVRWRDARALSDVPVAATDLVLTSVSVQPALRAS